MAPGSMPPAKRLPMTRSAPAAQRVDERAEVVEGVAVVGVGHDHEAPLGRGDARAERGAVAPFGHRDDPGPERFRDRLRAVGAAVVGDDDLAVDAQRLHRGPGLRDARGEGLGLVEAGQDDRKLDHGGVHPPCSDAALGHQDGTWLGGGVGRRLRGRRNLVVDRRVRRPGRAGATPARR